MSGLEMALRLLVLCAQIGVLCSLLQGGSTIFKFCILVGVRHSSFLHFHRNLEHKPSYFPHGVLGFWGFGVLGA